MSKKEQLEKEQEEVIEAMMQIVEMGYAIVFEVKE